MTLFEVQQTAGKASALLERALLEHAFALKKKNLFDLKDNRLLVPTQVE